jgi:hypothetical protein
MEVVWSCMCSADLLEHYTVVFRVCWCGFSSDTSDLWFSCWAMFVALVRSSWPY